MLWKGGLMQYRIVRVLNRLFFFVSACIIILWAGYFIIAGIYPDYGRYYLGGTVIASILLMSVFIWLEKNLDKRLITRMAREGHIALANIIAVKKVRVLRDATFTRYWLCEFQVNLYDREHKLHNKSFCEKMNYQITEIPSGTVYVTYDSTKDTGIFLLPTLLIRCLPELEPIISAYERDQGIDIKYLEAYYNKGMVLKTYQDVLGERKKPDVERRDEK